MGKGEAMMSMETMALLCRHEQWLRSHLVSPRTLHSCEREREREREREILSLPFIFTLSMAHVLSL